MAENGCKRCGWCCENVCINLGYNLSGHQADWFRTRGIRIVKNKNMYVMVFPLRCPYLQIENDRLTAKCQIDNIKPYICKHAVCPKTPGIVEIIQGLS